MVVEGAGGIICPFNLKEQKLLLPDVIKELGLDILVVASASLGTINSTVLTVEYATQLQQNGGFVPGIRPGKPTSDFLANVSTKITFIGSIALALLTIVPAIASRILGLQISFGGSSVIIVVGVIIETIKQIEAMMTMKQYKGFLNR